MHRQGIKVARVVHVRGDEGHLSAAVEFTEHLEAIGQRDPSPGKAHDVCLGAIGSMDGQRRVRPRKLPMKPHGSDGGVVKGY